MEVFSVDENRDKAKTHLQQMLTSLPKSKKKTSLNSNTSTIEKRTIMLTNILRKRNKSQKTSKNLGNLHVSDCS